VQNFRFYREMSVIIEVNAFDSLISALIRSYMSVVIELNSFDLLISAFNGH